MPPLTQNEVIKRFKKIHNNKYDYSKTIYTKASEKVKIICYEHGDFYQVAERHWKGRGCPKCAGNKKLTTEEIIEKFNTIHKYKYDYSKVKYINRNTKVEIICPVHGSFFQTPGNHLSRQNCPKCSKPEKVKKNKYTNQTIIEKFNSVHNKYNYSKVDYTNLATPVEIICPIHGSFFQRPDVHQRGFGCPECSGCVKNNQEEIIEKFNTIHKYKYDYSKVKYINRNTKVEIICPVHGSFFQTPGNHFDYGCLKCSGKNSLTREEFFKLSKKKHINFDYSKVKYINRNTKVEIICPVHGSFFQTPDNHLKSVFCCPECSLEHSRSYGEILVKKYLDNNNISYKEQYSFKNCRDKNRLTFDFYLPDYDVLIEYDGEQHFQKIDFFGGEEKFKKQQKRDQIKNNYCKTNNIDIIRIPYIFKNYIDEILRFKINKNKKC